MKRIAHGAESIGLLGLLGLLEFVGFIGFFELTSA